MSEVKLSLSERDTYIMKIEQQMEAKKKMLLEKHETIFKSTKFNNLLEDIRKDYQTYYNYIIEQKKQQIEALTILNEYIHQLTKNETLSENNRKDAKFEQKKILTEINNIKNNMDLFLKKIQKTSNEVYDPYKEKLSINEPSNPLPNKAV
jgi:hypothetical protein